MLQLSRYEQLSSSIALPLQPWYYRFDFDSKNYSPPKVLQFLFMNSLLGSLFESRMLPLA